MKIIITESKIENIIKKYIMMQDHVYDVDFETNRVHLGSGPNDKGETSVMQTNIIVYLNNVKNDVGHMTLFNIKLSIIRNLESFFNIDWRPYGSRWSFTFYEITRKPI